MANISTQQFLEASEIKEGILILKNKTLRGILMVSSVNFALKAEEEQNAIIYQFQDFINSLDFTLQIIVQSRRLNITGYLDKLKELEGHQDSKLLQTQTADYRKFIQDLITRGSIMSKNFFVIVPSHETLIYRLNQEIKKTKNTIEIVTTCKRLQYACYCFSESLNEAWKHNVKCRVLIEKPSMDQKAMFRKCYPKPWADIRFLSGKPSTVVAIFDNIEVFIMTRSNTALKESPALWSNNEGILSITRNYLEALWKDATVLENMILESPSK